MTELQRLFNKIVGGFTSVNGITEIKVEKELSMAVLKWPAHISFLDVQGGVEVEWGAINAINESAYVASIKFCPEGGCALKAQLKIMFFNNQEGPQAFLHLQC